mmetsp:Transcript_40713/g.39316  ORF Transcript_40713/g.39316 Transcript_40713/m.39316 type:complete len:80 (+) Transcript_40713:1188-1427(+)|eukprot:CAMPEP_0170546454 /NCGR_PEP_ID=MMETSP0211-20121228/4809_1 /TAXON_ID=311385 /ORGANISM="Pseudokeronopsis sp., Strain OXSARD2" /LENGTH=79 /DNA_ID=CAMNT_0010850933 /DNA_START=1124 /DNA_END=1363 /DNA_ORIENTATION=+
MEEEQNELDSIKYTPLMIDEEQYYSSDEPNDTNALKPGYKLFSLRRNSTIDYHQLLGMNGAPYPNINMEAIQQEVSPSP